MCPGAESRTGSDKLFYLRMSILESVGFGHKNEPTHNSVGHTGKLGFSDESFGQYTYHRYTPAERHLRQTASIATVVGAFGATLYGLAQASGIA
ncbi:MAG: hypothetical protein QG623_226 [Patescibacteria group bacterium]|nr:hypothetical protein [Patescibacteria group bacterium]